MVPQLLANCCKSLGCLEMVRQDVARQLGTRFGCCALAILHRTKIQAIVLSTGHKIGQQACSLNEGIALGVERQMRPCVYKTTRHSCKFMA